MIPPQPVLRPLGEDPIELAGGINLYGYANGDPVTYDDPYGLYVKYKDEISRSIMMKLRARSRLIDADLRAMEASPVVFLYRRDGLLEQVGTLYAASTDVFGRTLRIVQVYPFNVRRFGNDSVIRKLGGISEEIVYAYETHSHAGPVARKEGECDDMAGGHGKNTCGVRKENEWRKEQGLPEREYRGPRRPGF